ncbi:MAG: HNH endonuclease signature motif containing protein [Limnohabitans sp.]|nr:HNH endonuclease signature motif containing protein [Limnohabitans sp.]
MTRQEKYLSIRSFTEKQKRETFERQKGICPKCKVKFEIDEMEADHITPWHSGGKSTADNCQMLCKHDNRIKSGV